MKEKEAFQATPEEIAAWKKKHGNVFEVEATDKEGATYRGYVKSPNRNELSYASTISKSDPMRFNEAILQKCWLDGDEELKTNDELFMGVSQQLDEIIQIADAKIKKL